MNSENMKHNAVVPDSSSDKSKKEQVADMFNHIAEKYDFLNHFLSVGIDKSWRKKAIKFIQQNNPTKVLDIATGTGDLAIMAAQKIPDCRVTGVDIAAKMLEKGQEKINTLALQDRVQLSLGDSESLPFEAAQYHAILCAFGVRNFQHLEQGIAEMYRVMASQGALAILEFSKPQAFPIKQLYHFYFKYILPVLGKLFSKHSTAYQYLPDSVMAFPEGKDFCALLEKTGFKQVRQEKLTFGICSLYTAKK